MHKYPVKFHTSTNLYLKLTPEEIIASLGPGGRTIASEPFTWEQLQEIVNNGDPTMHSRSMEVQESYVLHSREIKNDWRSMNDYILYSKFGFGKNVDESGKFISNPTLEEAKLDKRVEMKLLLNEYPYFVCPGIEHWCLWKLGGQVEDVEVNWAVQELMNIMTEDDNKGVSDAASLQDVLTWVNPPHLQSIPDIDHAHLLCLRSTEL